MGRGRVRAAGFAAAAAHARDSTGDDGLCPPLALDRRALADRLALPLAAWGVFNPFGSSLVRLLAVEGEGDGPALLVHEIGHARHRRALLHGRVDGEPLPVLRALVHARARGGEEPLLPVPPTHVDLERSDLGETALRELLTGPLAGRDDFDLAAACGHLEVHGSDVKERTKDELRSALGAVMRRPLGRDRSPGPPSPELLRRWWSLVTNPEHVEAERRQIEELGARTLRMRPPLQSG